MNYREFAIAGASGLVLTGLVCLGISGPATGRTIAASPTQWVQAEGEAVLVPACGSSGASVTCQNGRPRVTITWQLEGNHGCERGAEISVTNGPSWSNQPPSGSLEWSGANSNQSYGYQVSYFADFNPRTPCGTSNTGGTFVTPACTPPLGVRCTASPTAIAPGGSVTWSAFPSGGSGSYRYLWSGTDGLTGSIQTVQKIYQTKGTKTASVTVSTDTASVSQTCATPVTVDDPPCIGSCSGGGGAGGAGGGGTFRANPQSISPGQSTTLTWTTQNATSCSIDNGVGSVATNGSKVVAPSETTTYTLSCSGPGGTASAQTTVIVGSPPQFREIIPE